MRMTTFASVGVAIICLTYQHAARADAIYAVTFERDSAVAMRDGIKLYADIFRPAAAGKFPVLLQRTPYDKNNVTEFGLKAAAQGYVVIVEDVRGRYASEGEWYPFKNEINDGYDTVEWAAALPYSDGKVGMFGGSYVGATQMLAAIAHPPHLAGICPYVTSSNYYSNWVYQGGAFEQWFSESWSSHLALDTLNRANKKRADALNGVATLPLVEYPILTETPSSQAKISMALAPYFEDWLSHPSYDDYWKAISIDDHFSDIRVPALHMTAWYDIFLAGSLRNYLGIKAHGGTAEARNGQRLLVTVGGHAGNGPKIGALDFGKDSNFDDDEASIRWYDYLFKGAKNEFASDKPITLFALGTNKIRHEYEWPLARSKKTRYFLHSKPVNPNKSPQTDGGSLSVTAPAMEKPDQYVYDPGNPAPTTGGPLCCGAFRTGVGPQDQRPVEARSDVLTYTTSAFSVPTEVTGPITLDLYVSSSAVDTDFTGMLVDVWPDGFAQNLTSGILRLRYQKSQEKPQLAKPGKIYHITLDMAATSNVFLAGHKLRLDVSSSDFPRFDRNMNTGEEQAHATRMVKATNVIYHDESQPSALTVPVVP
jgi:putative CocE/NonD family hydrolase